MSKRKEGKALVIFSLILGIVGVGLAGYMYIDSITNPPQEVINYDDYAAGYSFQAASVYETLPTSINITLNSNASLYISFNCWVLYSTATMVNVKIVINGIDTPQSMYFGGSDDRDSVTLQHYNASIAAGTYEITIKARTDIDVDTRFYSLTLYAQTIS